MLNFLLESIKTTIKSHESQSRIDILINHGSKKDFITVKLPKKHIRMIELIEMYGINEEKLEEILNLNLMGI